MSSPDTTRDSEPIVQLIIGYLDHRGVRIGPQQLRAEAAGIMEGVSKTLSDQWLNGYGAGAQESSEALKELEQIYTSIKQYIDHPTHKADPYWKQAVDAVRRIVALRIMNHIGEGE